MSTARPRSATPERIPGPGTRTAVRRTEVAQ